MEETVIGRLNDIMRRTNGVNGLEHLLPLAVELEQIRVSKEYKELQATDVYSTDRKRVWEKGNAADYVQNNRRLLCERVDIFVENAADLKKVTPGRLYQTIVENLLEQEYGLIELAMVLESANRGGHMICADFLGKTAAEMLCRPIAECIKKIPAVVDKPYVEDDTAEVLIESLRQMHLRQGYRTLNWDVYTSEQCVTAQREYATNKTIETLNGHLVKVGGVQGVLRSSRAGGLNKIRGIYSVAHHANNGAVYTLAGKDKQPSIGG